MSPCGILGLLKRFWACGGFAAAGRLTTDLRTFNLAEAGLRTFNLAEAAFRF